MSEWKPIETAPKGGAFREILVYSEKQGMYEIIGWVRYTNGSCWLNGSEEKMDISYFSHWMPLPAPPETKSQPD